jgi:hypothetical protein
MAKQIIQKNIVGHGIWFGHASLGTSFEGIAWVSDWDMVEIRTVDKF